MRGVRDPSGLARSQRPQGSVRGVRDPSGLARSQRPQGSVRGVPRQPVDLEARGNLKREDVALGRDLDERIAGQAGFEVEQDAGDRGCGGLVPGKQDPPRSGRTELHPACQLAAAGTEEQHLITRRSGARPTGGRTGQPVRQVQDEVHHHPGILPAPDQVADRVGTHHTALALRDGLPLLPPVLAEGEVGQTSGDAGEDHLDPLVEGLPGGAEVGQFGAGEPHPGEDRREPLDPVDGGQGERARHGGVRSGASADGRRPGR